jgi:hypothetical protein
MGYGLESQGVAEVGVIGQVRDEAAVVGFQERLEDQTGEQLRLGKLLGTILVSVGA